jgi:FAD-linked sulfhydryl oxidase
LRVRCVLPTSRLVLSPFDSCRYCADRTSDEIEVNPPRVASQPEFALWMCELHNEVNFRMNKPIFDCSKVAERWRTGPSDGSCS